MTDLTRVINLGACPLRSKNVRRTLIMRRLCASHNAHKLNPRINNHSYGNLFRGEGLASELAESNDPKPIAFRSYAAYGDVHQPVEDEKNHEYEAIPLMPLTRLQPARGSGPTSSHQTSGPYENTRALQDHRAVISGQARSTAPPLIAYLNRWGETSTSMSQRVAQPPLPRPPLPLLVIKIYKDMECGPVAVVPQDI